MKYDFSQEHIIKIKGKPDEIKAWVFEISNFMDKGISYSMLSDELSELEKIVEPVQYTFGAYHRIYFNHNSLFYIPNASGDARSFHFAVFKKLFDEAKKKMDEKYK